MEEYRSMEPEETEISLPFSDPVVDMPVSEEPDIKKTKKLKWWMVLIPAVLIPVLLVAVFWEAIYLRIAPTAVLAAAFVNTATDVSGRMEDTITTALKKAVDDQGRSTIHASAKMDYQTYLSMNLDMTTQSDASQIQSLSDIHGEINIMNYLSYDLDFGVYVDKYSAALRWDQIAGSDYYGIVYDTLGEDIRNNDVLYSMIGEDNLAAFEESVDRYQKQLEFQPESYVPSEAYLEVLINFLKEQKPAVSSEVFAVHGEELKCDKLTYTVVNQDVALLLEQFIAVMEEDEDLKNFYTSYQETFLWEDDWDTRLEDMRETVQNVQENNGQSVLQFYLYGDRVVYLEAVYEEEEETVFEASVLLGKNSAEDDIQICGSIDTDDRKGSLELMLSTEKDEETVEESVTLHLVTEDDEIDLEFGYEWEKDDSDLTLWIFYESEWEDALNLTIPMEFYEEENGFRIVLDDIAGFLLSIDPDRADSLDGFTMSVEYIAEAGSEIVIPDFINLGDLTAADIVRIEDNLNDSYGS